MRPIGASAGLHVLAMLPAGIDEAAVIESAAAFGVEATGLRHTYHDPANAPGGYVGYGQVGASDIDAGVRLVAKSVDAQR